MAQYKHNREAYSFGMHLMNNHSMKSLVLHVKGNVLCITIIIGINSDKYSYRSNPSTLEVIFCNSQIIYITNNWFS